MREKTLTLIMAAAIAALLCLAAGSAARAEESNLGTVVLTPAVFCNNSGTDASQQAAIRSIDEAFEHAGYRVIPSDEAQNTWNSLGIPLPTQHIAPTEGNIDRFGNTLKARFVVMPMFDLSSSDTNAAATVSLKIRDLPEDRMAYKCMSVTATSDDTFDTSATGNDVLISPIVSVETNAPEATREEHAVQIAVARAMRDFVHTPDYGTDDRV